MFEKTSKFWAAEPLILPIIRHTDCTNHTNRNLFRQTALRKCVRVNICSLDYGWRVECWITAGIQYFVIQTITRNIEKECKIRENENENEKRKFWNLSRSARKKQRDTGLNILPRVKPESALINYVQCASVKRRISGGGGECGRSNM